MCHGTSIPTHSILGGEQHMDIYAPLNNKYYHWYMNICCSRQLLDRKKKNNFTNHHIIPDSFYINRKRNKHTKDGWLEGNPNENYKYGIIN